MPSAPPEWWQATVYFHDHAAAEHTAAHHLAPAWSGLDWFFMRKRGAWRCRIRLPQVASTQRAARDQLPAHLDGLVASGHLNSWARVEYEPETRAFGGLEAMEAAHTLWCTDTHHLMDLLSGPDREVGRRELAVLLCRTLLCAAGLDRYEQGDVWDKVAATRPRPADEPAWVPSLHHQMHRLLSIDPGPAAEHFAAGPFAAHAARARAFHTCGRALVELAAGGRLERGLRSVLAHHVLFAWNRFGVPAAEQSAFSHTAAAVIFDPEEVGL